MQKIIATFALFAILGCAIAAPAVPNSTWTRDPTLVANSTTDANLTNSTILRVHTNKDNVLVQGRTQNGDGNYTVVQKSVAVKDLSSTANATTYQLVSNVTGAVQGQVHVATLYDNELTFTVEQGNTTNTVYVQKNKLASGAAPNKQSILTVNGTVQIHHLVAHTYSKAVFALYTRLNTTGDKSGVLGIVGVDAEGTKTYASILDNNASLNVVPTCTGIAGQNDLYCVWQQINTTVVNNTANTTNGTNGTTNGTNGTTNGTNGTTNGTSGTTNGTNGTTNGTNGTTNGTEPKNTTDNTTNSTTNGTEPKNTTDNTTNSTTNGTEPKNTTDNTTNGTTNGTVPKETIVARRMLDDKNTTDNLTYNSTYGIVEARVTPGKDVKSVNLIFNATETVSPLSKPQAWTAAKAYGILYTTQNGLVLRNSLNTTNTTTVTPAQGSNLVTLLPKNETLALLWRDASKGNLQVQVFNPTNNTLGNTTDLITSGAEQLEVVQHETGSVYVLSYDNAKTLVYLGQVWGSTGLAASVLEVAVYACFAFVAALFVF